MSTITIACPCGHRLIERVDFIAPAYIVTFADADTRLHVTACPTCNRPLYAALRDGELRPTA